jgi:hypothetical protein
VARAKALVKGWRNRGIRCESGTVDPAAAAPEFEVWGLECEGMSGNA